MILLLRERSFSLFVSYLLESTSKTELEAMFCRGGQIVDKVILWNRSSNKSRGFAFVRSATSREAEKALDFAHGRSWGDRKVRVNLSQSRANKPGFQPNLHSISEKRTPSSHSANYRAMDWKWVVKSTPSGGSDSRNLMNLGDPKKRVAAGW